MSRPPGTDRIQDLLDGLLSPAEEAELRRHVAADPELGRRHRQLSSVWALLDTPLDVAEPPGLEARILAAVQRDRERARRALPVPGWMENVLVVAGAAGLAGLVAVGRLTGPTPPEWVARCVVEGLRAFELLKTAVVDLARWDWTLRLLGTLVRASATAIESSAAPLSGPTLVALAVSTSLAVALWRRHRTLRPGGIGNVHLLA
jgi:hypothetical protein